jgi:hypothetical protein
MAMTAILHRPLMWPRPRKQLLLVQLSTKQSSKGHWQRHWLPLAKLRKETDDLKRHHRHT